MRVLFWTQAFYPYIGGVEVASMGLIRALQKRGHEAMVVTSHGALDLPDADVVDGIEVHRFRFREALSQRRLDLYAAERRRLLSVKQRFQPELVQVYFTDPSVFFHFQTQPGRPVPTVVSVQIALPLSGGEIGTLARKTLCAANWTVAVSWDMLQHARRLAPEITGRSSVIYNGTEVPQEAPEPLDFQQPRVLCIGRVVREKGFDVAIAAFSSVIRKIPPARLVIAGDGPAMPELREQVARTGLGDAVDFLGWVPPERIPSLLNTATLVLMPSRWQEAFGIVALEAMRMGRPVIASKTGGLPELVIDGETGLVVPKEDPAALASACCRLLESPTLAENMGTAARARALETFSFVRHVEEHEGLFQRLVRELA